MYLRTIDLYTKEYVEDTFTLEELDGMPAVSKLADDLRDTSLQIDMSESSSEAINSAHESSATVAIQYNKEVMIKDA